MANTFRWMLLTSLAQFALSSSISSRADVVTCVETTSANVFANPSWEDGTVTGGWQYNCMKSPYDKAILVLQAVYRCAFRLDSVLTPTYRACDHHRCLLHGWLQVSVCPSFPTALWKFSDSINRTFTGNTIAGARLIRQTVSGLQVGTPYNVSVDFKAVVNPAYTLQVSCTFYMYHDTLTTNNLITQFNKVYTRSDDTWNTYGGTFIPASSSLEIGWVLACSNSYAASIFNVYFDNAVVDGEQTFLIWRVLHLFVRTKCVSHNYISFLSTRANLPTTNPQ